MFLQILSSDLGNSWSPTRQCYPRQRWYQLPEPITATLYFIGCDLCVKWFFIWLNLCICRVQASFVGSRLNKSNSVDPRNFNNTDRCLNGLNLATNLNTPILITQSLNEYDLVNLRERIWVGSLLNDDVDGWRLDPSLKGGRWEHACTTEVRSCTWTFWRSARIRESPLH